MKCLLLCCCGMLQLSAFFVQAAPVVTLGHGGMYEGRSITFNGTSLDIFLGNYLYLYSI